MLSCHRLVALAVVLTSVLPSAPAQTSSDLAELSLENLMNIEVTSVSKKEQNISDTAAAVFVITPDDIRRSQAKNLPDVLRMVPGVNVAQINANTWAISIRGFNQQFSNKLLVLVDGRSVYLPTFSGVFWDVLDMPLEDVERIEVIRGPGAVTWGANAVNGVINIITKKAFKTRRGLLVAGAGNLDRGFGTIQYGARLGDKADYRVFAKYQNVGEMPGLSTRGTDGWHTARTGFRLDSRLSARNDVFLQGDIYGGGVGGMNQQFQSIASPISVAVPVYTPVGGGFLQTDWTHRSSDRSSFNLQFSFDRYRRDDPLEERRNTFSLDFQHRVALAKRHDLVWGAGFRYSDSQSTGNYIVSLTPRNLGTHLYSAFAQDEVTLVPNRLSLTLGAKLEHNYFTGFGWMPNARMAWKASSRHMFWAAVSKARRTPSSVDTGLTVNLPGFLLPDGTPVLVRLLGNPRLHDELLLAYEAGYRAQFSHRLSIDLSGYRNYYDDLKSSEPAAPFAETNPPPFHMVMPLQAANRIDGTTHGVEVSANWKVFDHWTIQPGYAFEQVHLDFDHGGTGIQTLEMARGSSPRHWARLESHLNLPYAFECSVNGTFTDRLAAQAVPSYLRLDTQLTRGFGEHLTLSIVGQNLLKDRHLEFIDPQGAALPGLIKRSAYLQLAFTF